MLASRANIFQQMLDWPDEREREQVKFNALLEKWRSLNAEKIDRSVKNLVVLFHFYRIFWLVWLPERDIWLVDELKKGAIVLYYLKDWTTFYHRFYNQKIC